MKKKLVIYDGGEHFYMEGGLTITPLIGEVIEEIDLSEETEATIQAVRKNPKDKKLIDRLKKRV